MRQEPAFAVEAAAIADEFAAGADHAMAGHDDGDGIGPVGEAHGARGSGRVQFGGQFTVGGGSAGRNKAQEAPDTLLERRAAGIDGDAVDGGDIAREVVVHPAAEGAGAVAGSERDCTESGFERGGEALLAVIEPQGAEGFASPGQQEAADGRIDAVHVKFGHFRYDAPMRIACLLFTMAMGWGLGAENVPEVRIRVGPYAFPGATISVQANLVEMGVAVRDRRGNAVGGFTAADFAVFDNGKPQEITFFSEQQVGRPGASGQPQGAAGISGLQAETPTTAAPRSLALFFDDTHASLYDCRKAVLAAGKVVGEAQPADRIALYTGSGAVTLDFTTDREKLKAALVQIKPHWSRTQLDACVTMDPYQAYAVSHRLDETERQRALALAIACNCPSREPECVKEQPGWVQDAASNSWEIYRSGSEVVLDVLRIAVNRLAAMPENRILVLLSRGFVTGGMDRRKSAIIDAALRARIVLNGLNTEGLAAGGGRTGRRDPGLVERQMVLSEMMAGVAAATGGRYIKNDNDLTGALETLAAPPEVSYRLGFRPSREPDDTYHNLKVKVRNDSGYEVNARQGYWAEKVKPVETAQKRIDDAVLSSKEISEIPTSLRVTLPAPKSAGPIVVRVSVDARQLRFLKKSGRSMQELTFVAVLENAAGEYVAGKEAVMDLALTAPKLASMQATGIKAVMSFAAAPGDYWVRTVVREAGANRIGAATARFELH